MNLQNRITFLPLILVFIVGSFSLILIDYKLRIELNERVKKELEWIANAAIESLSLINTELSMEYVDHIAKSYHEVSDARLTFIDANGVVMGDSEVPFEHLVKLENHKNRSELQQAFNMGVGFATRYSSTLKDKLFYIAVYKSNISSYFPMGYYARASLPQSTIAHQMMKVRVALFFAMSLSLMTFVVLSVASSRWISASIKKDKLYLKVKINTYEQQIELMHKLDSLLSTCSELNEASIVVKQILPDLLPSTSGAVSIYKASRDKLELIMFWGDEWPGKLRYKPDQCWALRTGHNHQSSQTDTHIYCEHLAEMKDQSSTCIPLGAFGETIGVLHILRKTFDAGDTLLDNSIAKRIGLAIANIELRVSLREQATKDALTGLYNRHYLFEFLEKIVSRANRQDSEIGIIMIDIDYFKKFNDEYGHDAGDLVLKSVANKLKEMTRTDDIVSRYGGEEFCIVCPDCGLEQAQRVAEKLCAGVREMDVELNAKEFVKVTFSAGVAIYPLDSSSIEGVITRADNALYQAKDEGRDRVVTV